MRISSDFHDYYDIAMSEGQDQTLVYRRYARTEKFTKKDWPFYIAPFSGFLSNFTVTEHVIGFCGTLRPVLELSMKAGYAPNIKFCYSVKDVDEFMESALDRKKFKEYKEPERRSKWNTAWTRKWANHWDRLDTSSNVTKYFEKLENWYKDENKFSKYFENHTPVFVATYRPSHEKNADGVYTHYVGEVCFHTPLKDYDFTRIVPPYEAFQEISMWMGNQAVPMKLIPIMSDEVLREIRGFTKHSFRKPKSET